MIRTQKPVRVNGIIILFFVLINAIAIREGYTGNGAWYLCLILTLPLLLFAIVNNHR